MLNNISRKQHGFTLVEILVAMAITAVLLTAVVSFYRSSLFINRDTVNQANAVNQLKNAYNYLSRDVQMAGSVKVANPPTSSNFPLMLSWIDYSTNQTYTAIYSIDSNGTLTRNYTEPSGTSTLNVASNVNAALTNCTWTSAYDSNNDLIYYLTVNITISKGSSNESRQFVLHPRVIQSSSQNPTTTTLSLSPGSSYWGETVNLKANVLPTVGSGTVSSGSVTFLDGGVVIGISPVVNGQATYSVSNLLVNVHTLYSGLFR